MTPDTAQRARIEQFDDVPADDPDIFEDQLVAAVHQRAENGFSYVKTRDLAKMLDSTPMRVGTYMNRLEDADLIALWTSRGSKKTYEITVDK